MLVQNRFDGRAGARGVPGCGVFCPWSRTAEGAKSAVSEAKDGAANVAEGRPRSPARPAIVVNLDQKRPAQSWQLTEITTGRLGCKTDFGHQ